MRQFIFIEIFLNFCLSTVSNYDFSLIDKLNELTYIRVVNKFLIHDIYELFFPLLINCQTILHKVLDKLLWCIENFNLLMFIKNSKNVVRNYCLETKILDETSISIRLQFSRQSTLREEYPIVDI